MKDWIIEALQNLGGKGWPREVSKYIFGNIMNLS